MFVAFVRNGKQYLHLLEALLDVADYDCIGSIELVTALSSKRFFGTFNYLWRVWIRTREPGAGQSVNYAVSSGPEPVFVRVIFICIQRVNIAARRKVIDRQLLAGQKFIRKSKFPGMSLCKPAFDVSGDLIL